MNLLAHVLINYSVLSFFVPDVNTYLGAIIFFSVIFDIDHIVMYVKYFYFMTKKQQKYIKKHEIGWIRTAIQEPINLLLILLILGFLYFYLGKPLLILIGMSCLSLHVIIDILTVHTRPFYPFSERGVLLFIPKKIGSRITIEIICTITAALLFAAALALKYS